MQKNSNPKYFLDREDAAIQLFEAIPKGFFQNKEIVVVALSEGAVPIADFVAKRLNVDMDILLVEAITAPNNPELSIAKVSEIQEIAIHKALIEAFEINETFVYSEAKRVYDDKILAHLYKYRKGGTFQSVRDKAVLLIDECVETDLTMIVAIKSMISKGVKNIYIGTPVMDSFSYESLLQICDSIFCPYRIKDYISIEYYYKNLERLEFSELERIIDSYE